MSNAPLQAEVDASALLLCRLHGLVYSAELCRDDLPLYPFTHETVSSNHQCLALNFPGRFKMDHPLRDPDPDNNRGDHDAPADRFEHSVQQAVQRAAQRASVARSLLTYTHDPEV